MGGHDPQIIPYSDVVDGVLLRCDCGCGLYETHPTRESAEQTRDQPDTGGAP